MLALVVCNLAFAPTVNNVAIKQLAAPGSAVTVAERLAEPLMCEQARVFELKIPLGQAGTANLRFKPREATSEAIVVRYPIPFGLNVANQGGKAVCTKDGAGGEKVQSALTPATRPQTSTGLVRRWATYFATVLTTVCSSPAATGAGSSALRPPLEERSDGS